MNITLRIFLVALAIAFIENPIRVNAALPNTIYLPTIQNQVSSSGIVSEEDFIQTVYDGTVFVRGVYAPDLFALKVIQQPDRQSGFISMQPDTVTQFSLAEIFGVIGLLAHNNQAGSYFFDLEIDDTVTIILGNGGYISYRVSRIDQFQALDPESIYSNFIDLNTGEYLTANQLFQREYIGKNQVTFQTCIARDGEPSWGRYFVVAELN